MNAPFALPDWLPWWVPVLLMIPVAVYVVAFALMPFSVFGVKGRLSLIDARLDEIQEEIRALTLRLPESRRPLVPPLPAAPAEEPRQPPPGDAAMAEDEAASRRPRPAAPPERPPRSEPRLDWPR